MNAIFTDLADFDPASFKMPAGLADSEGPFLFDIPEPPPAVQQLNQQLQREQARKAPTPDSPAVQARLKHNLQHSASDGRAERLKPLLARLRVNAAEDAMLPQELMQIIASLKSCYAAADAPRDLATMSVLHPLLQCQACKWDALKSGQPAVAPAAEAGYLQKLRQLRGSLGPLERAILLQLILALNQKLSAMTVVVSTPTPARASAAAKDSGAAAAAAASFDPIQASRLMLQLRARLQRTHSATEKQALQDQLVQLQQQQGAFWGQRQLQSLARQCQELQEDCCRLAQAGATDFARWRPLRLKALQNLSRLLSQPPACPAGVALLESAQQQLARLDLPEGTHWLAQEQARQTSAWMSARDGLAPDLLKALADWQQRFTALMALLQQQHQSWAQNARCTERQAQLQALARARQDWAQQEAELKALENSYLKCQDPVERRQLQQQLLAAYAELLVQLPTV